MDVFCDFVGSGGTFGGVAAFLKEQNPQIRCFVVEPSGAAILAGQPITSPNHKVAKSSLPPNMRAPPLAGVGSTALCSGKALRARKAP